VAALEVLENQSARLVLGDRSEDEGVVCSELEFTGLTK
jgi:hypothetical protein